MRILSLGRSNTLMVPCFSCSGKEIQMTGQYDEMSERSGINYKGGTEEQRKVRDLLKSKMEENNFIVYEHEWWHYDFQGWEKYRIENIQFSEIK